MCEHIESCRIKVLRVSGTMAQPYRTRLSAIAQIRDDIFNLPGKSGKWVAVLGDVSTHTDRSAGASALGGLKYYCSRSFAQVGGVSLGSPRHFCFTRPLRLSYKLNCSDVTPCVGPLDKATSVPSPTKHQS